jgi:hypothetical protein
MRTLSLIAPRSRNDETNLQSIHDGKMTVSAIQSGGPRALHASASQTRVHSVALPDTNDIIRRFNRDTEWLATIVVSAVVSAALMLAVLVPDRHPKAVDLTERAVQAGGDLLLNANSATLFKNVGLKGKKSTGEITSGQAVALITRSLKFLRRKILPRRWKPQRRLQLPFWHARLK